MCPGTAGTPPRRPRTSETRLFLAVELVVCLAGVLMTAQAVGDPRSFCL
jgi:hypothetical protein